MTNEKALELLGGLTGTFAANRSCEADPYKRASYQEHIEALEFAITMIFEHLPVRLMTLGELRSIYDLREDHVWPYNTPPYLWVETNRNTAHYWMSWSNVIACLEGQFPKYDPDDYGKSWRCWTSRPTDAQREATPWN